MKATRRTRIEKAGFKVRSIMSKDRPSKVIVTRSGFQDKIFDSVSAAHRYYFGY